MEDRDEYGQPYPLNIDEWYEIVRPAMEEWGKKVAYRIKKRLNLEHLTDYELGEFIEKVIDSKNGTVFSFPSGE